MNYDPHCVAGLLKSFLREIPEPILTSKMKLDFFSSSSKSLYQLQPHAPLMSVIFLSLSLVASPSIDIEEREQRLSEISRLIAALPQCNFDLLKVVGFLFFFFFSFFSFLFFARRNDSLKPVNGRSWAI